MTIAEYQELSRRTQSEKLQAGEMVNDGRMIVHAALGLAAETGEVCGLFQKVYQGHRVDRDHLIKELGDVLWFLAEVCDCYSLPMEQVFVANVDKLKDRYKIKFTEEESLHRKPGDV